MYPWGEPALNKNLVNRPFYAAFLENEELGLRDRQPRAAIRDQAA